MKCAVIVAIEQGQEPEPAQAPAIVSVNTAWTHEQGPFTEIAVKVMGGVTPGGEDFSWVMPGIEAALADQCDWILLLDPGAVVTPNVFSEFEEALASTPTAAAIFGLLCHYDAKDGTPVLSDGQPAEIGDYADLLRHDPDTLTGISHFVRTPEIAGHFPKAELGSAAFVRYRQDLWQAGSAIRVPRIFSIARKRPGVSGPLGEPQPATRHGLRHGPWRKSMRRNPITVEVPVDGLPSPLWINDPAKLDQAELFEGRLHRGTLLPGLQELRDRGLLRARPALLEIGPGSGAELCWLRHHLDASWIGAMEPDPDLREILMRNLDASGDRCQLDIHAPVLADKQADGMRMLIPSLQHLPQDAAPLDGLKRTIPAATVDSLFGGHAVDLIRIDRRHHVQSVLQGAEGLIAASRPILWVEVAESDIISLHQRWVRKRDYQLFSGVRVTGVMNHLLIPLELLTEDAHWAHPKAWLLAPPRSAVG